MFLIVAKLVEVLARAAFTVAVTFALPLDGAGRFGILVTLIGLFAFAIGWERYIDLQRRLVGVDANVFDRAVRNAFRLWTFNALLLVPAFVLVAGVWSGIGAFDLFLCVVILLSELLSNQIYTLAIVQPRYRTLVGWVAARNTVLLPLLAYPLLFAPSLATLDYVLGAWAAVGGASSLVILALWLRRLDWSRPAAPLPTATALFAQHRASLTHFGVGLLGIVSLQIDRLTVGGLLPLDQVGVYFRHVLLVSFVYQFFNIASYNRKVPAIFARARTHDIADAKGIVRVEQLRVWAGVAGGFALVWLADRLTEGVWTARFSIRLDLAALLLAGSLIRIGADYRAMILHSRMRETWVLRQQLISFGAGALLLFALTLQFGMFGTAAAMVATSCLYLLLNRIAVARLERTTGGAET
jgi:O-antigen/teichoic acid export membrane protein